MINLIEVYRNGYETAVKNDEINAWTISSLTNVFCKTALENFIDAGFENPGQKNVAFDKLLEAFSIDRLMWVLAFSVWACPEEFSGKIVRWAASVIPEHFPMQETAQWILHGHFDEISWMTEKIAHHWQEMGLLDFSACSEEIGNQDCAGKLLILHPATLSDSAKTPVAQYFYATDASQNSAYIRGYHLSNHQEMTGHRRNFLGIADEEQLPAWAKNWMKQLHAPKMQIRIFQLAYIKNTGHPVYENYASVVESGGINSAVYRQIYGGTVNCSRLEEIPEFFSMNPPPGYHSMCVYPGDVIQVCDGENTGFYFYDASGFHPVDFDISQTDHAQMLRILTVECDKEPYIAEICSEIEDGYPIPDNSWVPLIRFDPFQAAAVFCPESNDSDTPANRFVGEKLVYGTFMIIGTEQKPDGEAARISLTDSQIVAFMELFSRPLIYHEEAQEEVICPYCGFSQA